MASFVCALSADGKSSHLPLGRVIEAYPETGDIDGLLPRLAAGRGGVRFPG